MAADIIGLTRVSGPRLLIALDPGLGAIRGAGTSSKLRSHANGASIVTINFPQLVLWTIILIILVIALLGGFSGIGGGLFYGTGYYGGGGLGLVIVVLLVLLLLGKI